MCEKQMIWAVYLTTQRIIIYDVKGLVPHRLEEKKLSNIYMFTYHESLNNLEREESSHARRPAGSVLGLGSWVLGFGGLPAQ